jgi:RNA polymerase sigma-70 factor (ECF subfamily)
VRVEETVPDPDPETQREVVEAFLAAARDGDFDRLVAVLDPDAVLRADLGPAAGSGEVRGAEAIARQAVTFSRLGLAIELALINGAVGLVTRRDGEPFSVTGFTVKAGRIVAMDILADPERLRRLDLTLLD